MNRTLSSLLSALVLVFPAAGAGAGDESTSLECSRSARFLAPADSPARRQYAPDREVEVLHLALDLTPDFKHRSLEGKATLRFRPLVRPIRELRLDAVGLDVRSVTATEKLRAWQVTGENLVLTFAAPVAAGSEVGLTVLYRAEPARGTLFPDARARL